MSVIVLDVGKTTLKASLIDVEGRILQGLEAPNQTIEDWGYRVQDLVHAWTFMKKSTRELMREASVTDIIVSTHGSSGMLVNGDQSVTPLPDYESVMPIEIDRLYARYADDLEERGSNIGGGPRHLAKQLFWLQHEYPQVFEKAQKLLPAPQYWAWKLSGIYSMDTTSLTAQSHLWNAREQRFTRIVGRHRWRDLMSPVHEPSYIIGPLVEPFLLQTGENHTVNVRCGVHDSAANFHRYQAAGFKDFILLSGGTWLVGLSDSPTHSVPDGVDVTFQQSAMGTPIVSCRAMAGREFDLLSAGHHQSAEAEVINTLIARRTFALPSFQARDGLIFGSGGKGKILGLQPANSAEKVALALMYYVLLADLCIDYLGSPKTVIIDGNITRQPMLGPLLKYLNPHSEILISSNPNGTAIGAAMLAGAKATKAAWPVVAHSSAIDLPGLREYRAEWRSLQSQLN